MVCGCCSCVIGVCTVLQCSFSNGGHLFAAVHGNIIQIYSTTTFENIANLKGHNGKVRSVVWSADDNKIVSCGLDGAVYEWDTINGKRIGESVLKSCSYTSVAITPDGKTMFAVGSDKKLKEIADSQVCVSIARLLCVFCHLSKCFSFLWHLYCRGYIDLVLTSDLEENFPSTHFHSFMVYSLSCFIYFCSLFCWIHYCMLLMYILMVFLLLVICVF